MKGQEVGFSLNGPTREREKEQAGIEVEEVLKRHVKQKQNSHILQLPHLDSDHLSVHLQAPQSSPFTCAAESNAFAAFSYLFISFQSI
ncbi:hypothetical protein VNO80_08188 [Phaseolus coccineus]|uniref:Uncharacterized protein n=1 Tax=Phaseolus coccineus TaxID=3886 RepID=A0AAN9RJ65_PHACN